MVGIEEFDLRFLYHKQGVWRIIESVVGNSDALTGLYQETKDKQFLEKAIQYLELALNLASSFPKLPQEDPEVLGGIERALSVLRSQLVQDGAVVKIWPSLDSELN